METTTFTVQGLRLKGYKVEIQHLRRPKGKSSHHMLQKHEFSDRNMINPKGGATKATLTTPEGKELTSQVGVFHTDTYCKRVGISEAIKRALSGQSI